MAAVMISVVYAVGVYGTLVVSTATMAGRETYCAHEGRMGNKAAKFALTRHQEHTLWPPGVKCSFELSRNRRLVIRTGWLSDMRFMILAVAFWIIIMTVLIRVRQRNERHV